MKIRHTEFKKEKFHVSEDMDASKQITLDDNGIIVNAEGEPKEFDAKAAELFLKVPGFEEVTDNQDIDTEEEPDNETEAKNGDTGEGIAGEGETGSEGAEDDPPEGGAKTEGDIEGGEEEEVGEVQDQVQDQEQFQDQEQVQEQDQVNDKPQVGDIRMHPKTGKKQKFNENSRWVNVTDEGE